MTDKGQLARWGLRAIVGVILVVTLAPAGATATSAFGCVLCGEFGLADAIKNVILFVPFGVALALRGVPPVRAIIIGALLSAGIEALQVMIPGRDASLGDLLTNTVGTAVGIALARTAPRWLAPRDRMAGQLSLVAALSAVLLMGLTGFLLQPSFPQTRYYGQWTPDLGHLEWYRGEVEEAAVGPVRIASAEISATDSVRSLLLAGGPIQVRAAAGPRVPALASLFSIYDHLQREIVLIGPDRDDLVFRLRLRATDLRLDRPDLRFRGIMRPVVPGDSFDVTVAGTSSSYCITMNGTQRCLGFTFGSGWALLHYVEHFPAWLMRGLNGLWLAVLLLPFGFWARPSVPAAIGGLALVLSLALLPGVVGLLPTAAHEWLGAFAGTMSGWTLGRTARRRMALRPRSADMRRLIPTGLRGHLRALRTLAPPSTTAYLRLLARRPSPWRLPPRGPVPSVLFVCHGNIMRSAFAAALWEARPVRTPDGRASKALCGGMHTRAGQPAEPQAVQVASESAISLARHRSTPVDAALIQASELIFAMDLLNAAELMARFPAARNRIFLLGALGGGSQVDIPDPYGADLGEVRACFRQIEACVAALARHLTAPPQRT